MKNVFRCLVFIIFVCSLFSCGITSVPLRTEKPQDNKTYKIDYLFEHDGVRVYRFYDRGNRVYFTTQGNITGIKGDSVVTQTIKLEGERSE